MRISNLQVGTLGFASSWPVLTPYQRNPYRKHNIWNIVISERYMLHRQVLLECPSVWEIQINFRNFKQQIIKTLHITMTFHAKYIIICKT